jgi:hypothetical protein
MKPLLAHLLLLSAPAMLLAQPADVDKLKQMPIAAGGGQVGDLLRQWWKAGTASGNAGDFYDNRDGDHSPLNLKPYPQLSLFKYSPDDLTKKRNWAAAREIRPHVTFGNSSTSAPAHLGGSNPRNYYVAQLGLSFLYQQYTKNNLYIYPEHRDHDPGRNGRGDGFGDLYPTNTPYLLISQGSSGSDQPFMRVMPSVLAAFRPEVKAKLIETGTLMPTIQMLLRSTNKHLKGPKEYLTAKAHPTVFEGSWVDELALVQKAHALELKSLPPMVQLRVHDSDKAVNGVDFFDLAPSEVIGYTPACIARVHRTSADRQRIVVSADASYDLNKSKLTYTWIVLRGDPAKIKIVPKKDDASTVEITVAYHERGPIAPDSPLESNRVDIGVFVHNGVHYSAPGFVTIHTLDQEARVYQPDGKLLEIAHGMGEAELRVTDWQKTLKRISSDADITKLLDINANHKAILADQAMVYQKRVDAINAAQSAVTAIEKAMKDVGDKAKAKKNLDAARQELTKAQKAASDLLDRQVDPLAGSVRQFVESRIAKHVADPLFTVHQREWLKEHRTKVNDAKIKAAWQKLVRFGIAQPDETLKPLMPGKTLADAKWTKFEKAQLAWLHAKLLAEFALPGSVQALWHANYTDHRLSAHREWRDVYRHDPKREILGWTRYSADGVQAFNHEGLLVVDTDALGRCARARPVQYWRDPGSAKGINMNPLRAIPGDTVVRYEFEGADDLRGRRAGMETIPVKK